MTRAGSITAGSSWDFTAIPISHGERRVRMKPDIAGQWAPIRTKTEHGPGADWRVLGRLSWKSPFSAALWRCNNIGILLRDHFFKFSYLA